MPESWDPSAMKYTDFSFSLKAAIAEGMGLALLVYFGAGTASAFEAADHPWNSKSNAGLPTCFAFGFGIALLVYMTAHISGGQINPVVSLGLCLAGQLGPVQMAANVISHCVGGIVGAYLLKATVPGTRILGANALGPNVEPTQALLGEIIMTFVLMYTVLQVACNKNSVAQNIAPLAVGFAVFLGHSALITIDGCGLNPARTLGTALASNTWADFWIFVVGPLVGAAVAVPVHFFIQYAPDVGCGQEKLADSDEPLKADI